MKTVRIYFDGFWEGFNFENNMLTNILRERYHVVIDRNDPDFVICSPLGTPFSYMKYDCVRILYTGEPFSPDFNVFDYAISFDHMTCLDADRQDRHYRFPLCYWFVDDVLSGTRGMTYEDAKRTLEEKKYFCNFIYGHQSRLGEREHLLKTIQNYKRVECAGKFLNNMPNGEAVPFNEKKMEFLRQCKFTIACESMTRPGFVTEKIVDPFCNHSIPIYFGNPFVETEFNPESFINCHQYGSFEEALERIKEIDQNDELYIKMLMQPKLISDTYLTDIYQGLKEFLWRIVSQDKKTAYRRMPYYLCQYYEEHLDNYRKLHGNIASKIICRLKK